MRLVLVLSGNVGSGKSTIAAAVAKAVSAERVSTRSLILARKQVASERHALQAAGDALDRETSFAWVADGAGEAAAASNASTQVLIVDAIRHHQQVDHLRSRFPGIVRHVHAVASPDELERRHVARNHEVEEPQSYAEVGANATEQGVVDLAGDADAIIDITRLDPASIAAAALGGTGLLLSEAPQRLVDVLVGGQYGSEGKGNICSLIAPEYDVLVRVGGPNAGHIVYDPYFKFAQLPSGTLHNRKARLVLGPATTISLETLFDEMKRLEAEQCNITPERLAIDPQAIIIEQQDREWEEGELEVIGSTKQGVGSATARKILGRGGGRSFGAPARLARDVEELRPFISPTFVELENAFAARKRVLLEGTQGTDISLHHGMWPHVTSRDTTVAGCLADAGIAPHRLRDIIMVVRTYPIRVGGTSGYLGPEIDAETIAQRSGLDVEAIKTTETGTISGKPRRIAEFDIGQVRRAAAINGATIIAMTFGDYLGAENTNAKVYDELNHDCQKRVKAIEEATGVSVGFVSVGPGCAKIIDRRRK